MKSMGRALTIMARQDVREIVMHEDVSAWGAPSECHQSVSRGEFLRRREARRLAKSVSGLSRAAFNRELARGGGLGGRVWSSLVSRLYERMSPFAAS